MTDLYVLEALGVPQGVPMVEGVRERPGGLAPVHGAALANVTEPGKVLLSSSPLPAFQLSETTAESHLMEKELEELKSVSRRRK